MSYSILAPIYQFDFTGKKRIFAFFNERGHHIPTYFSIFSLYVEMEPFNRLDCSRDLIQGQRVCSIRNGQKRHYPVAYV